MKKARIVLAVFSVALTIFLGTLVWVMLDASSSPMSDLLLRGLLMVGGVILVSQVLYSLKGQIFDSDGRFAKNEVLFAIICFQLIMQLGFGFSLYAANQTSLQNESYDKAYEYFIELQQKTKKDLVEEYQSLDLTSNMPAYVKNVFAVTDAEYDDSNNHFRFPVIGGMLIMEKSEYLNQRNREFAIHLIMTLVISVLLMVELVLFAAKNINNQSRNNARSSAPGYLRQLAFVFYFAGYLGVPLITIMAKNLCIGRENAEFLAALPYSTEALANCVAIVFADSLFRKLNWKPPYIIGISIFVCGIVFSAIAGDIVTFVLSRFVVGLGYGLCWMTLRNVTSISGDRAENFSGLTSGIYAGIMCAAAIGTVLADKIGFQNVLFLSAGLSAIAVCFPLALKNQASERKSSCGVKISLSKRDIAAFSLVLLAIVIPTCISEAFCNYVSPLYINELNLPTDYIGRVSLLYNLCIVYIGSTFLIKLIKKIKSKLIQNAIHLLMISAGLIICAIQGGYYGIAIAAAMLGTADGFGFSAQNAYILETTVAKRVGETRMLTYFSLFKKFGAMLGPVVFSLFMAGGISGLGLMGLIFVACAVICAVFVPMLRTDPDR